MAKHHPDLIMCMKQPGIAIGRLCEKCDGRCPICDSYVRPATLVRICDECNYGSYEGRCVICGGPGISDAYYCRECTLQEKDRDGCPKIINLGSARTDLFYERKKYNFKDDRATCEDNAGPADTEADRACGGSEGASPNIGLGPSPPLTADWAAGHAVGPGTQVDEGLLRYIRQNMVDFDTSECLREPATSKKAKKFRRKAARRACDGGDCDAESPVTAVVLRYKK